MNAALLPLALALSLGLAAPRTKAPNEPHLDLYVDGPDGLEFVQRLAPGRARVALPLTTRSERIVRAHPGRRGVEFVLDAGEGGGELTALRLYRFEHDGAARVVVDDETAWLVSDSRPPATLASSIGRDVGSFVRRDASGQRGGTIVAGATAPEHASPRSGEADATSAREGAVARGGETTADTNAAVGEGASSGASSTEVASATPIEAGARHSTEVEAWVIAGARLPLAHSAARLDARLGGRAEPLATDLPTGNAAARVLPGSAEELWLALAPRTFVDRIERARVRPIDRGEFAPLPARRARPLEAGARGLERRRGEGPEYPTLEARAARDRSRAELDALDARLVEWETASAAAGAEGDPDASDVAPIAVPDALALRFDAPPEVEAERATTLLLELDWSPGPRVATRDRSSAAPNDGSRTRTGADADTRTTRDELAPLFEDIAPGTALDLVHFEGPDLQLDIRPTMGPGAAWGDVDGDGFVDLFLPQGAGRPGAAPVRGRLLANRAGQGFEDVTDASGLDARGAGMGALFFDADGDGDLDLYVANYGRDELWRNDGHGHFDEIGARVGLDVPGWSAAVIAGDPDRDGDLDLYVTSYLVYDESQMPPIEELGGYQREDPVEMLPFAFPGGRNTFLRCELDPSADPPLRYVDATDELELADAQGRGMQAVFWDFDVDGDDDLYIANDVSFNVMLRNEGDGRFRDVTFSLGLDDPRGGMGLAIGDVDRDGDEDLFLTNWELEANALYVNTSVASSRTKSWRSLFRDGTVRSGLGPSGVGVTSWAPVLFDVENDGDLDLFIANGYTSPDYESTGICVGQPNHLFLGDGEGRFEDARAAAGPALEPERASRCALACDFDQDGGLDLVVTSNNGATQLLANRAPARGHWLGVRLRGAGPNTRAIGARVTVVADGEEWTQTLRAGTGYIGGNAPELHFGLGAIDAIERVEVHWPSGRTSVHESVALDGFATWSEPR